ncbi:hypothetical protein KP509_26G032800 [Ceratopteris richardii]|uniref:Uncharacterized protein n=1 Tax=Ceratopteris richardii TaxID=49495 RepID=A0A8T2RLF5_CERRI|nr:hypothetical protein KP509_26G032800 [Ceratopteris richardii]
MERGAETSGCFNGSADAASSSFIMKVQHLIERCLTFYLDREECAQALFTHAAIDPIITRTVWKELEKTNTEFFRQYNRERVTRKSSLVTMDSNADIENNSSLSSLTQESLEDISSEIKTRISTRRS